MNDLMTRARMADQGSPQPQSQHVPQQTNNTKKSRDFSPMKIVTSILLVAVSVLVLAMLAFIVFGGNGTKESELIKSGQYQAVFLNDTSGQVYFGKLEVLNARMYRLTDIYYVRVDTPVQPNTGNQTAQQNISLAKLGNELHGPEDEMFINRDAVLFWENLKDDGQVVRAITEFKQNGGSTNNQTQSQNQNSTTNTDDSTNNTNTTNNTNSNTNSTNNR